MSDHDRYAAARLRTAQKRLRLIFRAAVAAGDSGYQINLTPFNAELSVMPTPDNSRTARRYAITYLAAARAHMAFGNLDSAREILAPLVVLCRQYALRHQKLMAITMLTAITRQQNESAETYGYLDEAIATAAAARKRQSVRRFENQMVVAQAVCDYHASIRLASGLAFLDEPQPKNHDEYTVIRLEPATAIGAIPVRKLRLSIPWRSCRNRRTKPGHV